MTHVVGTPAPSSQRLKQLDLLGQYAAVVQAVTETPLHGAHSSWIKLCTNFVYYLLYNIYRQLNSRRQRNAQWRRKGVEGGRHCAGGGN